MKILYFILPTLTLVGSVSDKCFSQDLLSDLKKVNENYSSTENYVIEWSTYIIDYPENKIAMTMKKCGDNYFLIGNDQINCINGKKQLSLNTQEKLAVYGDGITPTTTANPIQIVDDLLTNEYTPKLSAQTNITRKYHCQSSRSKENYFDVWINVKDWTVVKVIQHLDETYGHGFVFELNHYLAYCDAGPEISIQTYCTFDKQNKLMLRAPYSDYEIINFETYKME